MLNNSWQDTVTPGDRSLENKQADSLKGLYVCQVFPQTSFNPLLELSSFPSSQILFLRHLSHQVFSLAVASLKSSAEILVFPVCCYYICLYGLWEN